MNEDLIEFIEEAPDTIVTLTTGKKVAIAESAIELIERIREEKIRVFRAMQFTE
jgi:flagellar protein FlbD